MSDCVAEWGARQAVTWDCREQEEGRWQPASTSGQEVVAKLEACIKMVTTGISAWKEQVETILGDQGGLSVRLSGEWG